VHGPHSPGAGAGDTAGAGGARGAGADRAGGVAGRTARPEEAYALSTPDTSAGGDLKRTFTGVWTLVYSTAKHQWLLDTAEVQLGG